MRPVTFAPTLVDSSFSSTLMNFTIHAPHSVGIPARPVVERSWLGRLLGIFGQDSTRTRYDATFVNASTGLYSERGLLELGARMLAECNRAKQPLALVLLNFRDLEASVKAAVVTSDESVVPALAMVRGMPPLTVLVSEAAPSREAERKAFDLPDRDFAAMAFPSTMPASLIAA